MGVLREKNYRIPFVKAGGSTFGLIWMDGATMIITYQLLSFLSMMSSLHFLICSGSACENDLSSTVFHLRVLTPTTQLTVKTVSCVHTEMVCQCYLESSRGNSNYMFVI